MVLVIPGRMGERGRGQSSLQEKTVSVSGINSGEELASGKRFLSFTEFAGMQQGGEALPPIAESTSVQFLCIPFRCGPGPGAWGQRVSSQHAVPAQQ